MYQQAPHYKRPGDTLVFPVDFSDFAVEVAETVEYTLRADPGVSVDIDLDGNDKFTVTVTGGTLGRAYSIAIRGETASGKSQVQSHRVRLREARDWSGIPIVGPIDPNDLDAPTGALFLLDGALLLNDSYLVIE